MIPQKLRTPLLFVVALLMLGIVWLALFQPAIPAKASNAISLQPPSFQEAASPQDAVALTAIADEAGIAAYFNAGSQIDLATVRDRYRTIEAETSNYIIGSVDVDDYTEWYDVHVYVHRDGWFLVYYLAADPPSKMLDAMAYGGNTQVDTIFEKVLAIIASEAGVAYPGATFWDFRYPNANRLMIIAEDQPDGDSFTVKLPSSYIFFDRSWAMVEGRLYLDGAYIGGDYQYKNGERGTFATNQMLPNTIHTIGVTSYRCCPGPDGYGRGFLVLIYRVP